MKIRLLYIGNLLGNKGYTPTTIDTLSENFRAAGYEVHAVSDKVSVVARMLHMILTVCKRRHQTDYVIIDTYSTLNFYYAYIISLLCRLFKIRYIPILHGGALPERLQNSPILSRQLFGYAYKNVAPSQYLYQAFEKFGLNNLEFIPNSIDLKQYPFVQKNYDKPQLLWVRSFAEIYHPQMALEVLEKIRTVYDNAYLTMVGPDKDGSLALVQKAAQERNLPVTFTGKLTKKQWIALSASHQIFINTTNFDNTPVSVMEAMALGFPIVSTNVGGIKFLIEDGVDGLLVNAGAADDMAKKVVQIMQDTQLRDSLISAAIQKSSNWDWDVVEKKWRELLY